MKIKIKDDYKFITKVLYDKNVLYYNANKLSFFQYISSHFKINLKDILYVIVDYNSTKTIDQLIDHHIKCKQAPILEYYTSIGGSLPHLYQELCIIISKQGIKLVTYV